MKILLLGHTGLLGLELHKQLAKKHHVVTLPRHVLDVRDSHDRNFFCSFLGVDRPDVVINCIGIVKQRESTPEEMIEVNALWPHRLAKMTQAIGARLIHFSTDCYADPDTYGRSKALGEVSAKGCLTLRTSFIGRHPTDKRGLVEWFLSQRGPVPGYTYAYYSGLTTIEVARAVGRVLAQPDKLDGVWRLGGQRISKYYLLKLLSNRYSFGTVLANYAPMPDKSFDSQALWAAIDYAPPSWAEMIDELAREYPL